MLIKDLKQHLNSFSNDEEVAYMIWSRPDVIDAATKRGLTLSNDQADEVLEFVDHHKDCELGISWTTIDWTNCFRLRSANAADVMRTSYFTFGFGHVHKIDGFTYDKDIVVKITSDDPRAVMFATFGRKWAMQYDEDDITDRFMSFFPCGIKELN